MKKALLILNDSLKNLEEIRQLFVDLGYEVQVTGSAKEGLPLGKKFGPEIIVYDFAIRSEEPEVITSVLHFEFPQTRLIVINGQMPRYINNKVSLGAEKIFIASSAVADIHAVLKKMERQETESELMC